MTRSPVLWHIEVSNYNEKARWALDYKSVPHERRARLPGAHMAVALWLTRGEVKTFPVLELDGDRIGDSTRIIERLEARYPELPLYPGDPEERVHALELEEFFDEQAGPHVRLLGQHEALKDPEALGRFAAEELGTLGDRAARAVGATVGAFMKLRYRVNAPGAAELAKRRIEAGLDRIEQELNGGDYLVGDRFTVADLSAAAILYPLERSPQAPRALYPEALRRYYDSFADRRAVEWVGEMFRRHRGSSAATRSSGLAAAPREQ